MKANKEKPLGAGAEKAVYEDKDNPQLAVGIFHEYRKESLNLIKGRFYLNKILHILFPKNR